MFEIKSVNFVEISYIYVTNPDSLLCLLSRQRVERPRNLFHLEAGMGVVSAPKRQDQLWGSPSVYEGLLLLEYSDRDDHFPPSNADVQNTGNQICSALCVFMVWFIILHKENFTFTFTWLLCLLPWIISRNGLIKRDTCPIWILSMWDHRNKMK